MAVDHIGLAIHGVSPDLDHPLHVGIPPANTRQGIALLLALGVGALLELEPGRVHLDVTNGHQRCAHQPVRHHRSAVTLQCPKTVDHIKTVKLSQLLAGHLCDLGSQLKAVACQ